MIRTLHFHCHGPGSIPGQGTINKTLQAMSFSQKKKIHYKTSYVPGDLVSGQATEQNCSGDTRKSQGQVCCW